MVPIVVVGHPKRERLANKLAAQVNADAVVWDMRTQGCGFNHLQAWKWLVEDFNTDWGVVLEDDVVPCSHFRRNLEEAIEHSPRPILNLYLGRGRPPQRQQDIARVITAPVSYYTDTEFWCTQGYAMRIDLFHFWPQVERRTRVHPIDEAIASWGNSIGESFAYCRESLVDHLDGPTLIQDHGDGQGRNGKTALWSPDCDPSGKELPEIRKAWLTARVSTDWTQGSRELPTDGRKK